MQIVQIHSHCKIYSILWRCVVLLNKTFIRFFCILSVSLTKRLQGDRGQNTHGPRRKFDKDRQSCPSYWHCGIVRINGYPWGVEKEKSARKRKWKFTVEIFTPFDVNIVKIWTFLTFNSRNIFCFGIKGIPSSIYEIGDRYHLPKSFKMNWLLCFLSFKKTSKALRWPASLHISINHDNAENEMTNEILKTSSWLFTYVASSPFNNEQVHVPWSFALKF